MQPTAETGRHFQGRFASGFEFFCHDLVQTARTRQKTDAFKKDYRQHRSGVEGSLSALVHGHGMRVSRYIGRKKRNLQTIFTGCAGEQPQLPYQKSWTLRSR